jgi:hypothetical protein
MRIKDRVEEKIDQAKRYYQNKRQAPVERKAHEQFKNRMRQVGEAERAGRITEERRQQRFREAREQEQRRRIPIEQRAKANVGKAYSRARTPARKIPKEDRVASRVGQGTRSFLSLIAPPDARQPRRTAPRKGRKGSRARQSQNAPVRATGAGYSPFGSGALNFGREFGTGGISFGHYRDSFSGQSPAPTRSTVRRGQRKVKRRNTRRDDGGGMFGSFRIF